MSYYFRNANIQYSFQSEYGSLHVLLFDEEYNKFGLQVLDFQTKSSFWTWKVKVSYE